MKQRDIEVILNNALVAVTQTARGDISTKRAGDLRRVAEELISPLLQFGEEVLPDGRRFITPEEIVFVLVAASCFVQTKHVMGKNNMSQYVKEKLDAIYGNGTDKS